ncbi:pentapeptide repeat-containing protein [Elusimicrobiota bacterium]
MNKSMQITIMFCAGTLLISQDFCRSADTAQAFRHTAKQSGYISDSDFATKLSAARTAITPKEQKEDIVEHPMPYKLVPEGSGYACKNAKGEKGFNQVDLNKLVKEKKEDRGWIEHVFDGVNLECADLTAYNTEMGAWANMTRFIGSNLNGAQFQGVYMRVFKMKNSTLFGANFRGATLDQAAFDRTDMRMADFTGADLCAGFSTRMNNSNLEGANFTGAEAQKVQFEASNLKRAVFDGANLLKAFFTAADLEDASLKGAYLENTVFKGAVLKRADFTETELLGADMSGAMADSAKFKGATYDRDSVLPFSNEEAARKGMVNIDEGIMAPQPPTGNELYDNAISALLETLTRYASYGEECTYGNVHDYCDDELYEKAYKYHDVSDKVERSIEFIKLAHTKNISKEKLPSLVHFQKPTDYDWPGADASSGSHLSKTKVDELWDYTVELIMLYTEKK